MLSASPVETTSRVSPWSREYSPTAEHVCCWERDSPVTDQEGRETERESLSVDVLLTATCLCSTWLSSRRVGNSGIASSCWEFTNVNTKSKHCFDSWNCMCLVAMIQVVTNIYICNTPEGLNPPMGSTPPFGYWVNLCLDLWPSYHLSNDS